MRFSTSALSAVLVATVASAQSTLTINTPTTALQECHPVALSWTGGVAPYYLDIYSSPGASLLEQLTLQPTTATSGTWTINLAASTQIYFSISDATGATATTSPVSITAGTDQSCFSATVFSDSVTANEAATAAPASAAGASSAATTDKSSASSSSSASKASSASASGSASTVAKSTATTSSGTSTATSATTTTTSASTSVATASGISSAAAATSSAASSAGLVQGSIGAALFGAVAALFV